MKTRLSYKIFAAFLATSFMVVALMAITYRYVVVTSFWDYINQNILGRMDHFTAALASEYRHHQGWDHLKADPDLWFSLMAASLSRDDYGRWTHSSEKDADPLPQVLKKYFQVPEQRANDSNTPTKPHWPR